VGEVARQEADSGPERDAAVEDLTDALRVFTVEVDVFVDGFARAHDMGRNELNAIMWVAEGTAVGHPVTAGELATRLRLGSPAVTALLDRLERAGHIQRVRDQVDRRRVTVRMQERAGRLAEEYFTPLGQRMSEAVADVNTADLVIAAHVIRRLTRAVNADS
jgi:DNA-binding MarR family transcriptional regulator